MEKTDLQIVIIGQKPTYCGHDLPKPNSVSGHASFLSFSCQGFWTSPVTVALIIVIIFNRLAWLLTKEKTPPDPSQTGGYAVYAFQL
jgi:hypothetical protein